MSFCRKREGSMRHGRNRSSIDCPQRRGGGFSVFPRDETMGDSGISKTMSLVIISRNDNYMGNSNWRFESALNFIGEQLKIIDALSLVEIVIVDWASAVPLREVLKVSDTAKQVIRYIEVPDTINRSVFNGVNFPQAVAQNVGLRRARGEFIALTSADILWGGDIFQSFFADDTSQGYRIKSLKRSLVFIPRKHIPREFVQRCPSMAEIEGYIDGEGRSLEVEPLMPYYMGGAGALLAHRDLWAESQGVDEKLSFWGWSDIDLALRFRLKYKCIDYYKMNKMFVYHLDHGPARSEAKAVPRPLNPHAFNSFRVNDKNWGLPQYKFAEYPDVHVPLLPSCRKASGGAGFHTRHLVNIFLFMFSKFNKRHWAYSFSIFLEFIVSHRKGPLGRHVFHAAKNIDRFFKNRRRQDTSYSLTRTK